MGGESLGEALLDERIIAAIGDLRAQHLESGQQAVSTERIVANHVLARAELGVEQAQGFRGRIAETLAAVEERDEFLDAVELDDGAFQAGVDVGDGGAEGVRFLNARIQNAGAFEGFANAADGIGEGFQLGDFILREFAQEAEQWPESGGNERPAFVQAELLVFQPFGIAEAVENLAGALAGIAQGGAFVIVEHDVRMGGEDFADQGDGLRVGNPPGLARDIGQALRAIDIDRRRRPGERPEKIPRHRGEEFFTEIRRRTWGGANHSRR